MQPTRKQLNYLRSLAQRTGQTFATPRTSAEASCEIQRLRGTPRSSTEEVVAERRAIRSALATGNGSRAAIREDEITGYGSTATWR